MRILVSTILLPAVLAAQGARSAVPSLTDSLRLDTAVRTGKLANGMTYFVRHNSRPEKRAELRLVVNAGSILEDDAQRGVAHFVEHMAFNGTKRFPKADIVNFLERIGMRFGADVNAYTSFDETVYMIQVPTDTAKLLATGLDILEDWAHNISFEPVEVQKERGVVIEEWRTGRDASTRISNKQFPVMLNESKYAVRLPIGTKENLETFPESLATKFYRDWYRPDLMSIVAVGDFDEAEMVKQIQAHFGPIPMPPSPRRRVDAPVPDHAETFVSIETDKEYQDKDVTLMWLRPRTRTRTVADLRRQLVLRFHDSMLNQRFAEISRRPDAPFVYASGGRGAFVRTKGVYELAAGVKDNGFAAAAEAMLTETERARRFGFTATEFDRVRTNYLRSLEQAFAERNKSESGGFAGAYVQAALSGDAVLGVATEKQLGDALAPTITLDEINAVARSTMSDSNRVILVAAPELADVKVPTREDMLGVYGRARTVTVAAYVDSVSDAPLIPKPPTPGRIVAERKLPEVDVLEWTLSNGAHLFLKPTTFKDDEVVFVGQSPGGLSLLPNADAQQLEIGSIAVNSGGLGEFTQTVLQKKLTGKRASASTSVSENSEYVSGGASAKDIETMFQLVWMRFTGARVDSSRFRASVSQIKALYSNQKNQPESVFSDTITVTMSQHNPRVRLFKPELLDSVDLSRTLSLYRARFADASGFNFFIVGSFSPDSVRPFVERYLASLPSLNRHEKARDNGIRPPTGVTQKVVKKGVEPKATTMLYFTSPCNYSWQERQVLGALWNLLDIRLREVLREDKSGTYGVNVSVDCNNIPYVRGNAVIEFQSAPERADELVNAMYAVIDTVKMGVISDSNMVKIRELTIRQHETSLKENGFWVEAMRDATEDGRDFRDFLRVPDLISKVTKEQIRDAARNYLRKEQVARFTLLPESTTPQPIKP